MTNYYRRNSQVYQEQGAPHAWGGAGFPARYEVRETFATPTLPVRTGFGEEEEGTDSPRLAEGPYDGGRHYEYPSISPPPPPSAAWKKGLSPMLGSSEEGGKGAALPPVPYPPSADPSGVPTSSAPKRRCCRLLPTSRKGRWICLAVLGLFLVTLITLVAIFFPKRPEFNVISLSAPNGGEDIQQTIISPTTKNMSDLSISLEFAVAISINNQNFINIQMHSLAIDAFVVVNETALDGSPGILSFAGLDSIPPVQAKGVPPRLIGTGRTSNKFFPSRKTTRFTSPFGIQYNPEFPEGGTIFEDPVMAEFLQACGLTNGGVQRRIAIRIRAVAKVTAIVPFTEIVDRNLLVSCPFSNAQMQEMLNNFGSKYRFNVTFPTEGAGTEAGDGAD